MAVRLVHAEPGHVGPAVVARVAVLAQTRSVLVISARLSAPALRRDLEAGGVDLSRVFILDVTSHGLHPRPNDPEHEAFVPGPAMLELIAKRSEQILRAKAERPATVLIDDVTTFAQYNPPEALAEILRHAMAMRSGRNEQEYVVSGSEPPRLMALVRSALREEHDILPSGELARRPPLPGQAAGTGVDLSKSLQSKR